MHPTTAPIPTTRTATRTIARRLQRIALLALAVLTVAAGVALAPPPASAQAPGAPKVLGPVGWNQSAMVAWAVPAPGDAPITSYKVERYHGDAAQPEKVLIRPAGTMYLVDPGLTNGDTYWYRVQAFSTDGASPWSEKRSTHPTPARGPLSPFTSSEAYVARAYQDFLGRPPTPTELEMDSALLVNTPVDQYLTSLAHRPARVAERHPVLRLYFAFFERSPDPGGATYWINKRKAGTNLTKIASSFAASSEFQTAYGQLTNQQFVAQIYVNVFDRQPDPAGLAYWTKKLDTKQATRGQVMVGFSESTEYAGTNGTPGKSTARVEASDAWLTIMRLAPTTVGLELSYAPHIAGGGTQGSLAMLLMPSAGYPKV